MFVTATSYSSRTQRSVERVNSIQSVTVSSSQGKDKVCHISVNDFDLFVGIEQAKLDVKNPLPGK